MSQNPYAPPQTKFTKSTSYLTLVIIQFFALSLLTTVVTVIVYKTAAVSGAVGIVLAGIISAALLGFMFGRRLEYSGVIASGITGSLLALPLSVLYLWSAPHTEKDFILSALGYWAIPFFGIVLSLLGNYLSKRNRQTST